ncbi:hypothetical protein ACEWY4_006186 [Coilia grayii]|uniref:Chemokine interleukin-8-like domain-containing protein n=1 Tax=Coilia grayii TaxID=363190 RepID=A0ABD1KD36_9TELE
MFLLCALSASGPIISCCLKTSATRVRLSLLQSYRVQNKAMCDGLRAVSFTTVKGATICSEPSLPWTKKAMAYLQKKHKSRSENDANSHDSNKPTLPGNSTFNHKLISHW